MELRHGLGMRCLERTEALRRLAGSRLGYLSLTSGALPRIIPVLFALDGGQIILRLPRDAPLPARPAGSVVSLLVSDIDPERASGWSIDIIGVAEIVTGGRQLSRCRQLDLPAWAADDLFVALSLHLITGLERAAPPDPWAPPPR